MLKEHNGNSLNLQRFYPESLRITKIREYEFKIILYMKSLKRSQCCPRCGMVSCGYHATRVRIVQDLPLFGKALILQISGYDYSCINEFCDQVAFAETHDCFVGRYERMTSRLEDFIFILSRETSSEGAAVICRKMGIKVSGDRINRMFRKKSDISIPPSGDSIGVDDFAYKKGHNYCTVICDGETHRVLDILDGRDGEALRKWLSRNPTVKRVSRDRAGTYAKAISDILPDAMQIADRFHLHQNLLDAVKEAFKRELPNQIAIPMQPENTPMPDPELVPQIQEAKGEDNLTLAEQRRYEVIVTMQRLLAEGYAPVRIKEMLKTTYNRIRRYATGDPLQLCRFSGGTPKEVENYRETISELLLQNAPQTQILNMISELGYQGKRTALSDYCRQLVRELGITYTPRRNRSGTPNAVQKPKHRYLTRAAVLKHAWSGAEMEPSDIEYITSTYPSVAEIYQCIKDFRKLYLKEDPISLDQFIERYAVSICPSLSSFASGLRMDKDAVQNSIISGLSNGFVEGVNTKIKAIKRLVYGRAKIDLLRVRVLVAR